MAADGGAAEAASSVVRVARVYATLESFGPLHFFLYLRTRKPSTRPKTRRKRKSEGPIERKYQRIKA